VAHELTGTPVADFCAALRQLCKDSCKDAAELRRAVGLRKTQWYDTLNGMRKRPPDWETFVRPLVLLCTDGDKKALTVWRRRHEVLVEVDEQIRRRDQAARRQGLTGSRAAAATVQPARTLPTSIASFSGRLAELRLLADAAGDPGTAVGICVIEGMPGVGKTSLALHAAHLAADRYPDGQLFLDLQGHAADLEPLTPLAALQSLLGSLGIAPPATMGDVDQYAAHYRSRLAGTRTLILLDSASDTDQIRPLLPATSDCLVIITSRQSLSGLDGAKVIALDPMDEKDSIDTFCAIAGSDRVAGDDPVLPEIVAYCGYLPLAISITAARLKRRKALRAGDIADQLRDEYSRLGQLRDGERNLAAVFDLSYRHLPEPQQQLFQLLGHHPGPDFSVDAAANLINASDRETELLLESLLDQNLLVQLIPGRYQFHDLVRAYASALAAAPDHDPGEALPEPVRNLLDFYLFTMLAADQYFERRLPRTYRPRATRPPRAGPLFRSPKEAREWVAAELPNLEAIARFAASRGCFSYTVAVAAASAQYLRDNGLWGLAIELHSLAVEAAQKSGDQAGRAVALANLAIMQRLTAAFGKAEAGLNEALKLYQKMADRGAQANVLTELAIVRRLTGKFSDAEALLTDALTKFAELEDRHGQAGALAELGFVQQQIGSFASASNTLGRALNHYSYLDNRSGEAGTLSYLGSVKVRLQEYSSAQDILSRALELYRELGDRNGQANALLFLGRVYAETDDHDRAEKSFLKARQLYQELGERRGKAGAQVYLGVVYLARGSHDDALACLSEGLDLFRAVKDSGGEVEALLHLAELTARTGTPRQAREQYCEALDLARRISSGKDEADALYGLALAHQSEGQRDIAKKYAQRAAKRYVSLGLLGSAERARAALTSLDGN
jgi:tetratricopeptide (TPR) repeat protein